MMLPGFWLHPSFNEALSHDAEVRLPLPLLAVMSLAGARTWLQPTGHGDMQGFDSSFAAMNY